MSLLANTSASPEQNFWKWFQTNEAALFDFEKNQEAIFDQILAKLHQVNPDLTFEFGPTKNGRREFIISADGIKAAFPSVEALYASAPAMPRWQFIKFRPQRAPADISYGSVHVKADSVRIQLQPAGAKTNIVVYLPAYSEAQHQSFMAITFLFLDQALGEYDVEMFVDKIDIKSVNEVPPGSYSLKQLPDAFDKALTKH